MSDENRIPGSQKSVSRMNKAGLIILCIIIAAAIASSSFSIIHFLSRDQVSDEPLQAPDIDPESAQTFGFLAKEKFPFGFDRAPERYIAVLHIEGVIEDKNKTYNQSWLISVISELKADSRNRAIMLYINSPGGGVYQADEVYLALKNYRKTGKPVYAYMGPLAASGGYYIACAAQNISANRNTLTGSIGVIAGQSVDVTGLMDKLGIKAVTITAGKNKNMMNYNAPLTEEQKAIMQSIADEAYEQFTDIVSANRKLPITQVRKLADGRIYTAYQAKKHGLIDSVCTWDKAMSELKIEKGVGADCSIEQFRPEEKNSLYDLMTGAISAIGTLTAAVRTGTVSQILAKAFVPTLPYPAYYCQR